MPPFSSHNGSHSEGDLLRELVHYTLVKQRRLLHEQGAHSQARMLVLLHRYGSLSQTKFGQIVGLEKSWISRALDRMVEQGLAERFTQEGDRRCVHVRLTAEGQSKAQALDGQLSELAQGLFARLPQAEQGEVAAALGKLVALLKADLFTAPEGK